MSHDSRSVCQLCGAAAEGQLHLHAIEDPQPFGTLPLCGQCFGTVLDLMEQPARLRELLLSGLKRQRAIPVRH
jgi:hypothetical protein